MIITTINNVPGKEIKEVYGFVSASTVRTKNIDFFYFFSWYIIYSSY